AWLPRAWLARAWLPRAWLARAWLACVGRACTRRAARPRNGGRRLGPPCLAGRRWPPRGGGRLSPGLTRLILLRSGRALPVHVCAPSQGLLPGRSLRRPARARIICDG